MSKPGMSASFLPGSGYIGWREDNGSAGVGRSIGSKMPLLTPKPQEGTHRLECKGKNPALSLLTEIIGYLGVRSLDPSLLLKSSPFDP